MLNKINYKIKKDQEEPKVLLTYSLALKT